MTFLAGQKLRAEDLNVLAQPLKGAIPIQAGTYLTTSGGTELALPKMSLAGITLGTNIAMQFQMALHLSGGTAGDTFDFFVRMTTPLSGLLVAQVRHIVASANQHNMTHIYNWVPSGGSITVANDSFHLSMARVAGAGVLAIEAGSISSFAAYAVRGTDVWTRVP